MPNEARSDTCQPAKVPTILLVDDDQALLRLLTLHLKSAGYAVEAVTSGEEALAKLHVFRPLLVITDLWMDGMDGMTLFDRIHATNPWLPVMVLTAHGTIAHAVEATQRGAFSYLTKPFDSDELTALVERAMSLYADSDVIIQPELSEGAWSEGIITRNEQMRTLLAQAHRAALFDVSVLIQGESGTGKELLARAIHRASKRAEHPFIALNCGAVPEELLESELFGHAKGAFTGATRDHKGLFQAAYGGTLFLDEIGDMPLTFQTKLLRVIQEEEVRPVGATQSIATDVRIVAATHRNLAEEVAQKRFREDLFYRLNVMPLETLPLRERREDIPLLANHFLEQFLSGQSRDAQRQLSPAAMEVLAAQAWSGNVRQLRNVVERSVVLSSAPVVSADQVSDALQGDEDALPSLADARRDSERRYLVQVLEIAGGNVTRAAQLAQRNRTEFYKLLNRHDIDPHRFRAAEAD